MTAKRAPFQCPYCGADARLGEAAEVYGDHYNDTRMWICTNWPKCDAYVGCHRGTTQPFGRLANRELRQLRIKAHSVFDAYWQRQCIPRALAYSMVLTREMGLEAKHAHIGKFDEVQCRRVIELFHTEPSKC